MEKYAKNKEYGMQVKRFAGFFSFFLLCFFSFTSAWSYPLDEITLTNCTDHNCTFPLPKIEHADYFSYKNNALYRQIYSMLRLGTYFERRDVGKGSHQGIDIATATGTPVYASADGEVMVAETRGDWGNVVVIKHQRNNQTLYTTYAHLSTMSVKVGQQVKEGEMIGTVGATGNATGPHLHFQIEKNQDTNHPFFPKGCQGSIDEIVNEGTCFAQVRAATLDPIFFLETSVSLAESANISPIERVYIQAEEMLFTGFLGGFMRTQSMQQLIIKRSEEKG
jgi:murein DD-endopeptidase MepM/ murein hydrolase activator NlpD